MKYILSWLFLIVVEAVRFYRVGDSVEVPWSLSSGHVTVVNATGDSVQVLRVESSGRGWFRSARHVRTERLLVSPGKYTLHSGRTPLGVIRVFAAVLEMTPGRSTGSERLPSCSLLTEFVTSTDGLAVHSFLNLADVHRLATAGCRSSHQLRKDWENRYLRELFDHEISQACRDFMRNGSDRDGCQCLLTTSHVDLTLRLQLNVNKCNRHPLVTEWVNSRNVTAIQHLVKMGLNFGHYQWYNVFNEIRDYEVARAVLNGGWAGNFADGRLSDLARDSRRFVEAVRDGHIPAQLSPCLDAKFNGKSAVEYAAMNCNLPLLRILVEHGARISMLGLSRMHAVSDALGLVAEKCSVDVIRYVFDVSRDPVWLKQSVVLHAASNRDRHEIIRDLVLGGDGIFQAVFWHPTEYRNISVLYSLILTGEPKLAEQLMQRYSGAMVVHLGDAKLRTALQAAGEVRNYRLFSDLLRQGASPFLPFGGGRNVLENIKDEQERNSLEELVIVVE